MKKLWTHRIAAALLLAVSMLALAPAPADAAVTVTRGKLSISSRFVHVQYTVVFSGTYPTGGETTSLAGFQVPVSYPPLYVNIVGKAGFIYQWVPGTTIANGKIIVWCDGAGGTNVPLTQHTNVSYVAGVTGDTITVYAVFDKGR